MHVMHRHRLPIICGIVVVAAAVILLLLLLISREAASPIPQHIRNQAKFALYYPTGTNFTIDTSSFKGDAKAVAYSVSDKQGTRFTVSIQPLPSKFDFVTFKKAFSETDEFAVKIGDVLVGEIEDALVASIRTTDNSWILINATSPDSQTELSTLSRQFVKAPD